MSDSESQERAGWGPCVPLRWGLGLSESLTPPKPSHESLFFFRCTEWL